MSELGFIYASWEDDDGGGGPPGGDGDGDGDGDGTWSPGDTISLVLGASPVRGCEAQPEETFTLTIPNSQSDVDSVRGATLFDFRGGCPDFGRKSETFEVFEVVFMDGSTLAFEFPFANGNVDPRIVSIQYS